jgi:hypothetical protein
LPCQKTKDKKGIKKHTYKHSLRSKAVEFGKKVFFFGQFSVGTSISLTAVALLLDECGKKTSDTNPRLGEIV